MDNTGAKKAELVQKMREMEEQIRKLGGRPKRATPATRLRLDLEAEVVVKLKEAAGPGGVSRLVTSWVEKFL